MYHLIRSNIARNMWAIMKQFNLPPNDERIRTMDPMTIDFILEEMSYDAEIEEKIAKGYDPNKTVEDDSFEEIYEAAKQGKKVTSLLDKDEDPNKIYEQVKEATEDKEYDKKLDERIKRAVANKKLERQHAHQVIQEGYNKLDALEEKLKQQNAKKVDGK